MAASDDRILPRPRAVDVLGVRVDDVTYDESVEILQAAIARRARTLVITPNPEFVMRARRDAAFRAILNQAELSIPDGIGLVLAARLAGDGLREHVQGTDLVLRLAALSPSAGYRWFLLGGFGDTAERAAAALTRLYPGLEIAGAAPGSPRPEDDDTTRSLIRSAGRVDILLVAYGAPNQEAWLHRNLGALDVPVGIGVGGVFNYLSGVAPRAPLWIRRAHFEWAHRLITQPWRIRRQVALPTFAALALAHAARVRATRLAQPRHDPRIG